MESYQETLDWLYAQLPMYQRVGAVAYKADLSKTWELMEHLGDPQNGFPALHVAGTNGKGSVCHMLASVLKAAGYKVGLYTSPHLVDFRERIRINGRMIPEDAVVNFVDEHRGFLVARGFSFFEMTVGMAFQYFDHEDVDIAVVEVGMGGRLDSTNVVNPLVCGITNIGYDHTQFLGETFSEIAGEKAGIIKPGVPVVVGRIQEETRAVFESAARQNEAPIHFAEESDLEIHNTDLIGPYQKENQNTALKMLELLGDSGWRIGVEAIQGGLATAGSSTGLKGRWEILQKDPMIICDTAHNPEGLRIVLEELLNQEYDQLFIVLGSLKDKDLSSILPLFPKEAHYYFVTPSIPRALSAHQLAEEAKKYGLSGDVIEDVVSALERAKNESSQDDLIFVGGSTFVVAEVL